MDQQPSEIAFSVVRMVLDDFRSTLTEMHAQFAIISENLSALTDHLQVHFPNLGHIPQAKTKPNAPAPLSADTSHPLGVHTLEAIESAFRLQDEILRKFKVLDQRMQGDVRIPWIMVLGRLEAQGNEDVKAELLKVDKEVDDLEKLHGNLGELISEIPLSKT